MLASRTSSTRRWNFTTALASLSGLRASANASRASAPHVGVGGISASPALLSRPRLRQHVRDGALGHFGAEENRLRQRRMRVDREADILGIGAHLEREHGLGDELARVDAHDSRSEDALGAFFVENLGQPLFAAHAERAPARGPGKDCLLVLDALGLR